MSSKTKLYYDNVRKHKHEMKETRICCKVVSKTNDEQIKNNKIKNLYLHMFGDIAAT
jgi:hypothetical protein